MRSRVRHSADDGARCVAWERAHQYTARAGAEPALVQGRSRVWLVARKQRVRDVVATPVYRPALYGVDRPGLTP